MQYQVKVNGQKVHDSGSDSYSAALRRFNQFLVGNMFNAALIRVVELIDDENPKCPVKSKTAWTSK